MKRVAVFCGSGFGAKAIYTQAAKQLGKAIVENNLELVYGGACVGLMGEIAKAVLELGGNVIGVIPKHLMEKEVALTELADLRVVESMHERKALMAQLSDGFIALPGGFGTLDELFEIITWAQLDFHSKPCGILNIDGYYNHLIKFMDHSAKEEFVREEHRNMIIIEEDPNELLKKFWSYQPPQFDKAEWIKNLMSNFNKA